MRLPTIQGVIDRRILANYRVDPAVLARVVPRPFRVKTVNGFGVGGICLIRLKGIRPAGLPAAIGMGSENAAHRISVEWDEADGRVGEGVYIPRRDSSSLLNVMAGGRIAPGIHHRATFVVREEAGRYEVAFRSDDGSAAVEVVGRVSQGWASGSVFESLEAASAFFERGAVGYSATNEAGRFDGLRLDCESWEVRALDVERTASSFFDDRAIFPEGSVEFDCALLMRGIRHRWKSLESLTCCSG